MNSYERALSGAREQALKLPEFEGVVEASERDRVRWAEEDRDARVRARRWLLFAAVLWPLFAVSWVVRFPEWDRDAALVIANLVSVSTPTPFLLWAAWLCRRRQFRAAIITRGIAASNLGLALMWALLNEWPELLVLAILLAVAGGRTLQVLGTRDLDGSDDPDSGFEPVRFRGLLTLALIMACTDAMTLLLISSSALTTLVWAAWSGESEYLGAWLPLILLLVASALMLVNIWGLSRLRTWALFTNMFANVAIAVLALRGMFTVSPLLAWLLATTAGIQLLLPIPILAAALGHPLPDRRDRVISILLRVVVPGLVLITIVGGLLPLERILPSYW